MKKVVLYDPSISSINLGDGIIAEAARRHLAPALEGAYCISFSTHTPVSLLYTRLTKDADAKYVLGSNLLRGRMNRPFRQWDIHLGNARAIGPATLVGAGWWQYGDDLNAYTSMLYRTVLDKRGPHSVRDSFTEQQLRKAGVRNVINTACPTMWDLTPEHCSHIPTGQGRHVVTTVTDYHRDFENDRRMLETLSSSYERVTLWLQGYGDDDYSSSITAGLGNVRLAAPSLDALNQALDEPETDFVGTRLHAGIRALQRGRRTIIVSIDNRAVEKGRDFGLVTVPRGAHEALRERVESSFETKIRIPQDAISAWKAAHSV